MEYSLDRHSVSYIITTQRGGREREREKKKKCKISWRVRRVIASSIVRRARVASARNNFAVKIFRRARAKKKRRREKASCSLRHEDDIAGGGVPSISLDEI